MGTLKRGIVALGIVITLPTVASVGCAVDVDKQACAAIMGSSAEGITALDMPTRKELKKLGYTMISYADGAICGRITKGHIAYPLYIGTCKGAYVRHSTKEEHFIGLNKKGLIDNGIAAGSVTSLPRMTDLIADYPEYRACG